MQRLFGRGFSKQWLTQAAHGYAIFPNKALSEGFSRALVQQKRKELLSPSLFYFDRKSFSWRRNPRNVHGREFSSFKGDELSIEKDAERKIGWLLKLFFAGTATFFAYQFFPYMGDNVMQQSISLLRVKDPLFKRMGASRLSRFAIDDKRRVKIVEMGGVQELLNMLKNAKDDRTQKEALKALVALSHSDIALEALHQAGAVLIINSVPNSADADVVTLKSVLLKRFQDTRYNTTTLGVDQIK